MCVCPLECLIHPVVEEWVVISFVHLEPLHQVHDVGQDDAARGQRSAVGRGGPGRATDLFSC